MTQELNLKDLIGKGLSPGEFMKNMQVREMLLSGIPNTKEQCLAVYENFTWELEEDRAFFASFGQGTQQLTCFILCTDWCPDVIWNVPVLFRVMEASRIPAEVLIMDEYLDVMDHFLTHGGRAQPIAVFLDADGRVVGRWGARPGYIQVVMDEFKQNHPDRHAEGYQEKLNQVYSSIGELYRAGNRYQTVMIRELMELFAGLQWEPSAGHTQV